MSTIKQGLDFRTSMLEYKERQISLYRFLTITLVALLGLSLIANVVVAKLTHVEPYLVTLDKRTGEVAVPHKLEVKHLSAQTTMIRHFAGEYVQKWTSYSPHNLKKPFLEIMATSSKEVGAQFRRYLLPKKNPESPVRKLGRGKYRTTKIHSISRLDKKTLDIRYQTQTKESSSDRLVSEKEYRAVLKYEIVRKKRTLSEWDANPTGFTVTYIDIQPVK